MPVFFNIFKHFLHAYDISLNYVIICGNELLPPVVGNPKFSCYYFGYCSSVVHGIGLYKLKNKKTLFFHSTLLLKFCRSLKKL